MRAFGALRVVAVSVVNVAEIDTEEFNARLFEAVYPRFV